MTIFIAAGASPSIRGGLSGGCGRIHKWVNTAERVVPWHMIFRSAEGIRDLGLRGGTTMEAASPRTSHTRGARWGKRGSGTRNEAIDIAGVCGATGALSGAICARICWHFRGITGTGRADACRAAITTQKCWHFRGTTLVGAVVARIGHELRYAAPREQRRAATLLLQNPAQFL